MKNNLTANQNPYDGGCKALEESIQRWSEGDMEYGIEAVLNTLIDEVWNETKVIVPVSLVIEDFNYDDDICVPGDDDSVEFRYIDSSDGTAWLPIFTSKTELEKGEPAASMSLSLMTAFKLSLRLSVDGIVLNPWGSSLAVPEKAVMTILASDPKKIPQHLLDLNAGSRHYQAGEFEDAFECYKKSAEAGNTTAVSNLGYCYYYGRSIPADKMKAKECWERAARDGDINAVYRLGDMYRNGDLPVNLERSSAMYKTAYKLAQYDKNIHSFPDAGLRILKYCSDDFSQEELLELAEEVVKGFRLRIEDGDNFTENLYAESVDILTSLRKKRGE